MLFRQTSTVQTNGQITLPVELRERLDLRKGDVVVFEATDGGILVNTPQSALVRLFDEIGDALRQEGVTLDMWMKNGSENRARLVKEKYGIDIGKGAT